MRLDRKRPGCRFYRWYDSRNVHDYSDGIDHKRKHYGVADCVADGDRAAIKLAIGQGPREVPP